MASIVRLAWAPLSAALSAELSEASPWLILARAPFWLRRTFEPSSKNAVLHSSLYGMAAASGSGGRFFLGGLFSASAFFEYSGLQPATVVIEKARAIASAIPRNRVVMPGPTISPRGA